MELRSTQMHTQTITTNIFLQRMECGFTSWSFYAMMKNIRMFTFVFPCSIEILFFLPVLGLGCKKINDPTKNNAFILLFLFSANDVHDDDHSVECSYPFTGSTQYTYIHVFNFISCVAALKKYAIPMSIPCVSSLTPCV